MSIKIGKISSVKRNASFNHQSLAGSLKSHGYNRMPGTVFQLPPFKEIGGKYRTGLDPDAAYISLMSEEEQEQERTKVQGYLDEIKKYYLDIDLSPTSPFYKDMTKKWGSTDVCPFAKLNDGDTIFDLTDPRQLIVYAYLRVHPQVAPSGEAVVSGKYPRCNFYVNDFDVETAVNYKKKSKIAKAIAKLETISLTTRKKIGRQLGLPTTENSSEEAVYDLLFDYINASTVAKTANNVDVFLKFAEMKAEHLEIRDIVKQAVTYNVYRKVKGSILNGDVKIGTNEQEAVEYLSDPKNQEELLSVQEAIKLKKSMK